jgi:hypothetical protein
MKKNILYSSLWVFLVLGLISCYPDAPEESTITGYAPFGVEGLSDMTVDEEDVSIPLNFTLNENQILDVDVLISVDPSSTATEGVDFDLSTHEVPVLALGGGGSFDVIIYSDIDAEDDETIVLNVGGGAPLGLPENAKITLTITNKINPISLLLDWDFGSFTFGGSTFGYCDNSYDLDLYFLGADGSDVSGYEAATGACPEAIGDIAQYGDGTYDLYVDFWHNPLIGYDLDGALPWRVDMLKGGTTEVFSILSTDYPAFPQWESTSLGADDGGEGTFTQIGSITIAGTTCTLFDVDGTELGAISN